MLNRSIRWGAKTIGACTLIIFALLVMALGSVVYGLSYLVRDVAFSQLLYISIIALLLSWLLACTRLPGWIAGLSLFILGAFLPFMWAGDLCGLLVTWVRVTSELLWQMLQLPEGYFVDTTAFLASLGEIKLRLITVLTELGLWLRSLNSGNPSFNYLAISLIWGFAIWLVSAWAGWFQRRRESPLMSILPAGILLSVSLGYTYGATTALFPLIFAVLLLVAVTPHITRERSWKERSIDFPKEDRSENFLLIFGITLGFVVAAAVIPRISIGWVVDVVQEWANPQVEQIEPIFESFGLQQDLTALGTMGPAMSGGLPREHLIGSGPELSDQLVMFVQLADGPSLEELQRLAVPLYWRGITYDHYTGYGWESSDVMLQTYAAEEIANHQDNSAYRLLQQDYRFVKKNDFIYAAGEIVSLDTDYRIAWRIVPGITETLKTPGDFFAGSQRKRAYRVDSLVPVISEDELRAAQGLYPSWVSERYLALPNNLSQRVIDLARDLTIDTPMPYDKARAIEQYLRTFKYELNLPAPPQNRELSDYFLFGLQKGYCDYYATTMVVLARSVGLPARIAIGYTHGSYDTMKDEFIVSEDNAHSWPEIYFSEIGWVPFEPTAAQAEISHPSAPVDLTPEVEQTFGLVVQDTPQEGQPPQWWRWFGGFLLGAALLPWIWFYLDGWYLRWLSPLKMAAKLYRRLYHQGSRLGSPARASDTPYEFAATLGTQIHAIIQNTRWEEYLHPAIDDIQNLSHIYVRSVYSLHLLNKTEAGQMISLWRRIRRRLLLAKVLHLWGYRNERQPVSGDVIMMDASPDAG